MSVPQRSSVNVCDCNRAPMEQIIGGAHLLTIVLAEITEGCVPTSGLQPGTLSCKPTRSYWSKICLIQITFRLPRQSGKMLKIICVI